MSQPSPTIVLCNAAPPPRKRGSAKRKTIRLDYRDSRKPNVRMSLPDFVTDVRHLPDRVLDLLEIAAYVFSADRFISRGPKAAVEYTRWARSIELHIKVRDHKFWKREAVQAKLAAVLEFMTGDKRYSFNFLPGHKTPPAHLFDAERFAITDAPQPVVMLFSGGLDSLAGAVEHLEASKGPVCLISHRSGQPETLKTQKALVEALQVEYPRRILHYSFYCSLRGVRAVEESQRTRAFLYGSIAFALSRALKTDEFFFHENGVTALNFPRRQDMINARASRTVHPRTVSLLEQFLSEVARKQFRIRTPFLWLTKSDVVHSLKRRGRQNLITSAVSCSKTFLDLGTASHCGGCSQCVDRRFGAYAAGLGELDEAGVYDMDFIRQEISEPEMKTTLIDYVRQARDYSKWNANHFNKRMLRELIHVTDHVGAKDEAEAVAKVWSLCKRHGDQVLAAVRRMREKHDDPFKPVQPGSFLRMVSDREYLKEPVQRLVAQIVHRLKRAVPTTFRRNLPKNESDFNDKVEAILKSDEEELHREYPAILFGIAKAVPDHSYTNHDLIIEAKYIRTSTTPSKATEGMAADLTKYSQKQHILFVVFDPMRAIPDMETFRSSFESRGGCTVLVCR